MVLSRGTGHGRVLADALQGLEGVTADRQAKQDFEFADPVLEFLDAGLRTPRRAGRSRQVILVFADGKRRGHLAGLQMLLRRRGTE